MKEIISKELLSAVLGWQNKEQNEIIDNINLKGNMVEIFYSHSDYGDDLEEINIYELAHKCKEWALTHNNDVDENGYYIFNSRYEVDDYETKITKFKVFITKLNYMYIDNSYNGRNIFSAHTEPEVIFKACQWILDNKETK